MFYMFCSYYYHNHTGLSVFVIFLNGFESALSTLLDQTVLTKTIGLNLAGVNDNHIKKTNDKTTNMVKIKI